MNRFRGRKKAKDDLAAPRPSVESESSSPFKMFGKSKKSQEDEPKPEVDLTTALPSNDDFRQSLLMTGLSARFSMLREQDDPNTKVGKASDDSVLYPKRQSRLTDFGFGGGLSDIAEVESIRAPFARNSDYQSDDAASISGSVMTRAKPTEGNNLFGGRQKIYKISGSGGKSGATAGRALYGDDVAQSAFQRWRQAEKDKDSNSLEELRQSDSFDSETTRPDSPPQSEYHRRRETSSTTSSAPSGTRNSTAATSITSSQPSQSVKEWQSATAASNPTPPLERSVTRTRRLYEQGLSQDLQNTQTSALSRIDTLSKQRNLNRTPDLTPTVPSPSSATFSDRFASSRSILNKASAPNLRSFSPPSTISSQTSPAESQNRFPGFEERAAFGATPPLSPPISETGEHQTISFPPEKTKPPPTSVLAKVAQYDESRYAQRQLQLQRGRETPTNFFRTESNVSGTTIRSRSPSTHRPAVEKHDSNSFSIQATLKEEGQTSTFFDEEEDDSSSDEIPMRSELSPPQVTVERPADHDHPAFRKSALPTPLSFEKDDSKNESPEDSPTLGPTSGGLSGMVRAHLRQDSNASSVYGPIPNDSDLASRFPPERDDIDAYEPVNAKANTWESIERGVAMSMDTDLPSPTMTKSSIDPQESVLETPSAHDSKIDLVRQNESDDFARHLADGARRVRERLTSYVESDSGNSIPPPPPVSELPPPPRPNALGILKAKSSRGSLVDRTRGEREIQGQTKAKKLLGLTGPSSTISLPTARPESLTDSESRFEQAQPQSDEGSDFDGRTSVERENVHAGLKAFRQARRELQRMKELEVQQRYQAPQVPPPQVPSPAPPQGPATRERAPSLRGPPSRQASQERRPPPVSYNRIPSEESWNGPSSRSASRAASERERSGSENSNSGRSGSRPPRLRNGSIPRDEYYTPMGSPGLNGMPRQGPMMRSPSHPHPGGNASPGRFNRFGEPSPNLGMPPRGFEHGQSSPVPSMNGAPSPYGPPSQRPFPQHPGNMDSDPSAKRMMRSRDPSDPSMLPSAQGPMGQRGGIPTNVNGNMGAPPLPPINPRRKTNPMNDMGRRSEDEAALRGRMPMSPMLPDESRGHGTLISDDESLTNYRQRLRKATSEANGMNARARSLRNSPPHPTVPPPMPPSMTGSGMPGGMI